MRTIITLSFCLFLCACAAGKEVMIKPQEEVSIFKCGDYEFNPSAFYADGFKVVYYIIPLLPWPSNSETESSLEIPIRIFSRKDPIPDLTLEDVAVRIPAVEIPISPYSIELYDEVSLPEKPYYHKSFKYIFDTNRHELESFDLIFPQETYGCTVPDVPYVIEKRFRIG